MFKRVENEIELALFNFIWMTAWREKGFEFEFSERALDRYVVISPEGEYAGSAEFKPYEPGASPLDAVAPFHLHPDVVASPGRVAEIDKIALLKDFRGILIAELLSAAVYFAWTRDIHYFVSLLEPVFHRALRVTFRVPMSPVGDKRFYKGDHVVPVLIDVRQMYTHRDRFGWLSFASGPDYDPADRSGYQFTN